MNALANNALTCGFAKICLNTPNRLRSEMISATSAPGLGTSESDWRESSSDGLEHSVGEDAPELERDLGFGMLP